MQRRALNSVRRLVGTGRRWRIETSSDEGSGDLRGEAVVIAPGSSTAGLWIGRDRTGERVVGWSTLHDRYAGPSSTLLRMSRTLGDELDVRQAALLLPASATIAALRALAPSGRVGVVGEGPIAAIVQAALTETADACESQSWRPDTLDSLVDASGEPARWARALPAVAPEGTVLLLVPPWAEPAEINFYPQFHRKSLRLVAGRWHRPPAGTDEQLLRSACDVTAAGARCVERLDLTSPGSEPGVWLSYDWPAA